MSAVKKVEIEVTKVKHEVKEFKPEFHAALSNINNYVDKLVRDKGKATLSIEEADKTRHSAMTVVSALAEVDKDGNFTNPIDRAIIDAIKAKSDVLVNDISSLIEEKKPSPLDYYDVYYKVLEDSGLLSNSIPEPQLLRSLVTTTGGFSGNFNLSAASACKACGVCALCSACAACSVCTISGVVGTGVVGATAGTIGLAGLFF